MAENVKISINTEAITKAFAKLQNADHSDLFARIAGIMADSTEQAFEDEKDPTTGKAWASLSEAYQAWRVKSGHDGKILQLSGSLATEISTEYDANSATIGSKKAYAAPHQFGSTKQGIAARPYLGLDNVAKKSILNAIKAHYQKDLS